MGWVALIEENEHTCPCCGEFVPLDMPLYLVEVVRGYTSEGGTRWEPALEEGTQVYPIHTVHEECLLEALTEVSAMSEEPDTLAVGAVGTCMCCDSHILAGELCGRITHGSIQPSVRSPDGDDALEWEPEPAGTVGWARRNGALCSVCLNYLAQMTPDPAEVSWYGDYVKQGMECDEGVFNRCWRRGPCEGPCHMYEEE